MCSASAVCRVNVLFYKRLAGRYTGGANGVRGGHVAFFPSGGGAALFTDTIARPLAPEVLGTHQAFSLPSLVEFFLVEFHRGNLRTGRATRQQIFVRTIYKNRGTSDIVNGRPTAGCGTSWLLPEMAENSAIIADEKGRVVIAPNCSTDNPDCCSPSLCSFGEVSGRALMKIALQHR